jgi:hypothetical protein
MLLRAALASDVDPSDVDPCDVDPNDVDPSDVDRPMLTTRAPLWRLRA